MCAAVQRSFLLSIYPALQTPTIVKQANLHTLKRFEELDIGIGDLVKVYKANKIIPEIEENLTRSKTQTHPTKCPVCGEPTIVEETDRTKKLYCSSCGRHCSQKQQVL